MFDGSKSPAAVRGSVPARLRLSPAGLNAVGRGRPLAGGSLSFEACELLRRSSSGRTTERLSLDRLEDRVTGLPDDEARLVRQQVERLCAPRKSVAGVAMDRPVIMGVVNVTPDSFSDGGETFTADDAIARGRAMAATGAAIIDVGGESTRPRSIPVSADEQLARTLPVIQALANDGLIVSIDTRLAAVTTAALDAGASIINDTSALEFDSASLDSAATNDAPVVLMHMQGTPKTMQDNPRYDDVVLDLLDYFESRIGACESAGIARGRLVIDPGIGFGKTLAHNLDLLAHIEAFHGLGCPVLVGASRKSMIARLSVGGAAGSRLGGSIAAALFCAARGVQILRVHDVAETRQAIDVWSAFLNAEDK